MTPLFRSFRWVEVAALTHQLSRQQGHVLYDGEAHPPLGVLRQLHDGGQQGLGQLADADHLVHAVQVGNNVEAHLGALRQKDGGAGIRAQPARAPE